MVGLVVLAHYCANLRRVGCHTANVCAERMRCQGEGNDDGTTSAVIASTKPAVLLESNCT